MTDKCLSNMGSIFNLVGLSLVCEANVYKH